MAMMPMPDMFEPITVEVFRDAEAKKLSVASAEHAVTVMQRIVYGIEMIRSTRLLSIGDPACDQVEITDIDTTVFEADINVILTKRTLTDEITPSHVSERTVGLSRILGGEGGLTRYALVDTYESSYPTYTILHEVGHLFYGLQRINNSCDDGMHCADKRCAMYPKFSNLIQMSVAFKERFMKRKPGVFCDECRSYLGQAALLLREEKQRLESQ